MNSDNAQQGIEWWNRLTETQRGFWLQVAGSATPADAWAAYQESVNTRVLYVYPVASGQWAGQLQEAGQLVLSVAGCDSTDDVEEAIQDAGYGAYSLVSLGQSPTIGL